MVCPQDYRRRKRIKLKSLAWARHHKECLYFHPRVYAQHAANNRDWRAFAQKNTWGDLWDNLPYEIWGWDPSHWYNQRHEHDTFDDCLAFDLLCSSIDPLTFHHFEVDTNRLAYKSMLTPRHHAFIAADQMKGGPHASAKFYSASSDNVTLVIDSGASTSVTPFFDDFVGKYAR